MSAKYSTTRWGPRGFRIPKATVKKRVNSAWEEPGRGKADANIVPKIYPHGHHKKKEATQSSTTEHGNTNNAKEHMWRMNSWNRCVSIA